MTLGQKFPFEGEYHLDTDIMLRKAFQKLDSQIESKKPGQRVRDVRNVLIFSSPFICTPSHNFIYPINKMSRRHTMTTSAMNTGAQAEVHQSQSTSSFVSGAEEGRLFSMELDS